MLATGAEGAAMLDVEPVADVEDGEPVPENAVPDAVGVVWVVDVLADGAELPIAAEDEAGAVGPPGPDDDAAGNDEEDDEEDDDAGGEDGVGDAGAAAAALTVFVTVPATAATVLAKGVEGTAGLEEELADGAEGEEPVPEDAAAGAADTI